MICNKTDAGWEVIFQRAHAQLALDLIAPWKPGLQPEPWTAILSATAQHDNGWQEWEPDGRLTKAGAPRDFTSVSLDDVATQSGPHLERAWHQSRWIGLLCSRHIASLYDQRRQGSDALNKLLGEQEDMRKKWRRSLGIKKADEDAAYAPLRWGDAFSLLLCMRNLPDDGRAIEIGPDAEGTRYDAYRRDDGTMAVEPWPYAPDRFEVGVDAYRLEQLVFESHDALLEALREASPARRTWTLRQTP